MTCNGCEKPKADMISFVAFEEAEARHERKEKRIVIAFTAIIMALILAFAGYAVYTQYMWSQFEYVDETVDVDSHEGTANYMGDNNTGNINNYGKN